MYVYVLTYVCTVYNCMLFVIYIMSMSGIYVGHTYIHNQVLSAYAALYMYLCEISGTSFPRKLQFQP